MAPVVGSGNCPACMARVAKAQTPIVVVDEGIDPARDNSLLHTLAFRALTLFDRIRQAPVDLLPAGAEHVQVSSVSRYYYCLTFQKGAVGASSAVSSD